MTTRQAIVYLILNLIGLALVLAPLFMLLWIQE